MTESKQKAVIKRRAVAKPRLYKELEITMEEHDMNDTTPIGQLLAAIKDDGWREQMEK